MWVLLVILAALAGAVAVGVLFDAMGRRFSRFERGCLLVFVAALMVASALVGAALQLGLG